jgi:DNA-binding transcriptional LysR family regulator
MEGAAGMELRQLRNLVEIVRLGNFGRAATVLGITQPALSKSIRTLETELGATLLDRGPNGVTTTPFGDILVQQAERSCCDLDRAVREIQMLRGTGRGLVQVGGSTTILRLCLPLILRRLDGEMRNSEIIVTEGLRDDLVAKLRAGALDLALCLTLDPQIAAEFQVEPLLKDDIAFVVHKSHPLCGRADLTLRDLVPYRWILPNRYEQERLNLARRFEAENLPPPSIAVQTSSSAIMAAMIADGDHISYLPRTLVDLGAVMEDLRALPLDSGMHAPDVCLLTRRSGVMLPPVRAFVAATRQVMREIAAEVTAGRPGLAAR